MDENNDAILSRFPSPPRQLVHTSGDDFDGAGDSFAEMSDGGDGGGGDGRGGIGHVNGTDECDVIDASGDIDGDGNIDEASDDGGGGGFGTAINNDEIIGGGGDFSVQMSEPDYDHLQVEDDDDDDDAERRSDDGSGISSSDDVASSPNYEHLGLGYNEEEIVAPASSFQDHDNGIVKNNKKEGPAVEVKAVDGHHFKAGEVEEVDDLGEEYILGTMLVRVLQARDVKPMSNNQDGGIAGFLLNHRRNRHQRSTVSPASAGWGSSLTPSSPFGNPQIYAKLSYRGLSQLTSTAIDHSVSGDYHWSRGDQSYFDVTCSAFPPRMNVSKAKQAASSGASCVKPSKNVQPTKEKGGRTRRRPPILQLSLYSKRNGSSSLGHKQGKWPFGGGDVLGRCNINVLRILCGKTPYFDEWCTLHRNGDPRSGDRNDRVESAGRVRIVIEYEPTDPPPRPGDLCVFANVHLLAKELYPIAPYSIRNSTDRSTPRPSSASLTCRPKTYRVEEVVGDNVVLSYQTPSEGWQCTFEVHRYLLLCVERHQAAVEKYREKALDLCDNLSQSPVVEILAKTMDSLPDEGLVHVGAELVGVSLGLLSRWWETGLDGLVEDLVDGTNLDGRHSHYSEEEEEGDENDDGEGAHVQRLLPPQPDQLTETSRDERKPIPGMPCCPITGQQMIEPVVAADGHTYERYAIARWLETSSRSPLTGEIFAHTKLVPNYLLLSSLGNDVKREDVGEESSETLDVL